MEELERNIRINALFDKYEPLLSKTQQKMIGLYYRDDLSLGEIAELENVSRNAVYDSVKKGIILLEEYEMKLHLLEKNKEVNELIDRILDMNISIEVTNLLNKVKERVNEWWRSNP